MTAAELIERLRQLPPETIIAIEGEDDEPHHVSWIALAVVHPAGVAYLDVSPRIITEKDVS